SDFSPRSKAREHTALLFFRFSTEIEGAGTHRVALLPLFCRDRRCGSTPRCSSRDFLPRSKAREHTALLCFRFSTEIEGAGAHRVALLPIFHRDRRRGNTPRCSSSDFSPRSKAREHTALLFFRFSTEIKGAGAHRVALLPLFYRDRRRGNTPRCSFSDFLSRSSAKKSFSFLSEDSDVHRR